jgi:hypothetical protein
VGGLLALHFAGHFGGLFLKISLMRRELARTSYELISKNIYIFIWLLQPILDPKRRINLLI